MKAIVTGSGGLVGSESVRALIAAGYDVVGIDNDMRARFFGADASTTRTTRELAEEFSEFRAVEVDIRDQARIDALFFQVRPEVVIHTAAQPSHDWAADNVFTDFAINATGTLNLLQAARAHAPAAPFVTISTSKVYGDEPNWLPLIVDRQRFTLPDDHEWANGITTDMRIDRSMHSLFGVSKAAGDLLTQEYGRYFGMPTCCLRLGCITGPAHRGAELHGFLAYLMRCAVEGRKYRIYGYGGKQVRCNISGADLAAACLAFCADPKQGAVYNLGGGPESSCSVFEAIERAEEITDREMSWELLDEPRRGDHRWWISDIEAFRADYPDWEPQDTLDGLMQQMFEAQSEPAWT
jgi:CDP-paratose 2-epimerase